MKLSAKGDYALRALMDLAINYNIRLVQTKEMASNHGIPEKFLEQILRDLKNARIVTAKSGINGGFALTRSPEKISFGEIIRLTDGPLAPINCVSLMYYNRCPEEPVCKFQMVMKEVRDAIAKIIDNTTLADVVQPNAPTNPPENCMYYI